MTSPQNSKPSNASESLNELQLLLTERYSSIQENRRVAIGQLALSLRLSESLLAELILQNKKLPGVKASGSMLYLNCEGSDLGSDDGSPMNSGSMKFDLSKNKRKNLSSIGIKIKYIHWISKGGQETNMPPLKMSIKRLRNILIDQSSLELIPDPTSNKIWFQNDSKTINNCINKNYSSEHVFSTPLKKNYEKKNNSPEGLSEYNSSFNRGKSSAKGKRFKLSRSLVQRARRSNGGPINFTKMAMGNNLVSIDDYDISDSKQTEASSPKSSHHSRKRSLQPTVRSNQKESYYKRCFSPLNKKKANGKVMPKKSNFHSNDSLPSEDSCLNLDNQPIAVQKRSSNFRISKTRPMSSTGNSLSKFSDQKLARIKFGSSFHISKSISTTNTNTNINKYRSRSPMVRKVREIISVAEIMNLDDIRLNKREYWKRLQIMRSLKTGADNTP